MIFNTVLSLGTKLIDELIETDSEKLAAKTKLIKLQQDGQLRQLQVELQLMLAEAKSADPWTSRARPSFLYVIYILILAAFPMGVVFWLSPSAASEIVTGVTSWLNAIPEPLWYMFGAGYLGYSGARSYDKAKLLAKSDNS